MKSLLVILSLLMTFFPVTAEENTSGEEVILPISPPQKVLQRFQTNFDYNHDRGFYLSAVIGPDWTHSVNKPKAKGVRFGAKLNAGAYVSDGFALFGSVWGNFLEAASIIAIGPGIAFLFDSTNMGVDFSFGIGRVFNIIKSEEIKNFSETVLATNLAISKYWWLSSNTSLGLSAFSGVHGLTLSEGKVSTFGWNAGLGLSFLLG